MKGTVKSFSDHYGYGFIVGEEDEREYFAHWSFIARPGLKALQSGQVVSFEPAQTHRGWQAHGIQPVVTGLEQFTLKPNPFTPHEPVTEPAKFAGRRDSLLNAIDALFNHKHVFVSGERGVGKTSLAIQLAYMTQGDTYLLEKLGVQLGDFAFRYLVLDHRCFPGHAIQDIVAGLVSALDGRLTTIERRSGKTISHRLDLKFYQGQLEEAYESTVRPELVSQFVMDLENSWSGLESGGYNGFCLFVDELDWLGEDVPVAFFLKSVVEKLRTDGYADVSFVLSGQTSYVGTLFRQHESSLRLFENVHISQMTMEESLEIIGRALEGTSVSITGTAAERIVALAAGFPTAVHQLGYHSFRYDSDNRIETNDVERALDHVIRELRNEEFTVKHQKLALGDEEQLIRAIAQFSDEEVSVEQLMKQTGMTDRRIHSNLGNLMVKGFIDRAQRGRFKIHEPLFRLYLRWKESSS